MYLYLKLYEPESKLKKRKRDDNAGTVITSDSDYNGSGLALAVKLWDLLHSSDYLQREITKLNQQLRIISGIDNWLNLFLTDLAIYKGLHHEVRARLLEGNTLSTNIRLACTSFFLKDYQVCYDYIRMIIFSLNLNYITVNNVSLIRQILSLII